MTRDGTGKKYAYFQKPEHRIRIEVKIGGIRQMFQKKRKYGERKAFWKRGHGLWGMEGLLLMTVCCGVLGGCSIETTNGTKVADLDYEIVEESEIPEEVKTIIEEKKAADFKTTYKLDGELYIVRGYGEQETGGYSICIRDCYLTSNAILFDTELVGPRKGEKVSTSPSYPYIVIKTENRDESIIFE